MRNPTLFVVAVLLVVMNHGCRKNSLEATVDSQRVPLAFKSTSAAKRALLDAILDSKSQGLDYRGGLLEGLDRPWSLTGEENGNIRLSSQFSIKGEPLQDIDAFLSPAGFDASNPTTRSLPIYKAEITYKGESIDPCATEEYIATSEEQSQYTTTQLTQLNGATLLVLGSWKDGRWAAKDAQGKPVYTLSCITGAIAKCTHWGYVPGNAHNGVPLDPYYQACVAATRAMYTKDDKSFTCPGKEINIYDNLNIMRRTQPIKLESLWTQQGLKCLNHARFSVCNSSLGSIIEPGSCQDPVTTVGGAWAAETAQSGTSMQGALIAVASEQETDDSRCRCIKDPRRDLPCEP